jgi:UDP-2,3-diacylglucosamine pyrophosphatase LpxH
LARERKTAFDPLDFGRQKAPAHLNSQGTNQTARVALGTGYASLFISDMHLGGRACRDEALLGFLRAHRADRIYLVGDIFDTWHGKGAHWTAPQHAVLQLLLDRAQDGVEIVYTPGNHDAVFRRYIGTQLGKISVVDHAIHTGADGRRYLVIHGDSVDIFSARFVLLSRMAAKAEHVFRGLGNAAQRRLHSLDLPIAAKVDRLVARINHVIRAQDNFQARLAALAQHHGTDGIICGHFHQPALHNDFGVTYANCGDWVENATALAERHTGELVQLSWAVAPKSVPSPLSAPTMLVEEP